jgi:hypothetical protein
VLCSGPEPLVSPLGIQKRGHSDSYKKRYLPLFLPEPRVTVRGRVRTPSVPVAIASGELIDKITILEIKSERINDEGKLEQVKNEFILVHRRYLMAKCQSRSVVTRARSVRAGVDPNGDRET